MTINTEMILKLHGRTEIFIPKQEVTEDNLPKILGKALAIHKQNELQIDYLWNYFLGIQEIKDKVKPVRPEINIKVLVNHAYEILNFYLGYVFGDPIQYVQRGVHGSKEGFSDVNNVSMLNELMMDDDKASKDNELSHWLLTCGWGYRMTLPCKTDDVIFETEILDPRETFVIKDTGFGKKPWMCVTYRKKVKDDQTYTQLSGYTDDLFFCCDDLNGSYINYYFEENPLGCLPIVQYKLNYVSLGCFEPVIVLNEVLNLLDSNRADGEIQFVQSFMKFVNCDINPDDFEELKKKGLIKIKVPQGMTGDVDIVSVALDQTQSQTYVEHLYQQMLQIAGVPDRNASAGGNTGQALIVGQGWSNAEARAKGIELSYKRSEKLFLNIVLKIIKDTIYAEPELKKLKTFDIDIKFTRNKTDSLLVKAQALLNLLEAGLHPRIAFTICGLFNDPEQAYVDSQPYLDAKWLRDLGNKVEDKQIKSENDVLPKTKVTG